MTGTLDPLMTAEGWRRDGRDVALATVIETWGSAPRPAGSHLVIDGDGNFEGSVSGGCVEGAVISEALDVIASGAPKMLELAWLMKLPGGWAYRAAGASASMSKGSSDGTCRSHAPECGEASPQGKPAGHQS